MATKANHWLTLALFAYLLSLLDVILTLRLGFELNPLLALLFAYDPMSLVIVKACLSPAFWFLGRCAPDRVIARCALVFLVGWYAATVTIQTAQLVAGRT